MKKRRLPPIVVTLLFFGLVSAVGEEASTSIIFDTGKRTNVPVYRIEGIYTVAGASSDPIAEKLVPFIVAPTTLSVPNGIYLLNIGGDDRYNRRFVVEADGGSQRWLIKPKGRFTDLFAVTTGLCAGYTVMLLTTIGHTGDDWFSSYLMATISTAATTVSAIGWITSLPKAKRIE